MAQRRDRVTTLGSNYQSISYQGRHPSKLAGSEGCGNCMSGATSGSSFGPSRGREQPNQSSSKGGRNVATFSVRQRHSTARGHLLAVAYSSLRLYTHRLLNDGCLPVTSEIPNERNAGDWFARESILICGGRGGSKLQ